MNPLTDPVPRRKVAGKMETRSTPSPLSHPPHLRSTPSYSSMHNSSPSPSVDAAARRPKAKVSSDDIGRVSAQARVNNAVKRPEPPSRGTSRKVVGGVESPLGGVRTPQRVMNGERETTTPIAGSSTSNSGRRGVRATVTLNQVIEPGSHRNGTANIGRPFPISTPVSERASLLSSANTTTTPSDVPRVRAKLEYSPAISPTLSTSLARENGGFGSHVTPTMKRGISHAGRSMDAVIQESRNDVDSQESPRQGVSPRSTARVVARSKRLQQDGADIVEGEGGYFGQGAAQHAESSAMGARRHVKTDSGSDKNSLISHRSSGTGIGSHDVASVRSGSRASERDGMGYRSDDVGSLKSPGVGFVERIAEEEDIGASDPGNDKIDGLEEGEGLGDLDEEPATGQEKAKRDRRHEDLKITNEALNRMNERLEAKLAAQNRLVDTLRRRLRTSGRLPPGVSHPRSTSGTDTPEAEEGDFDDCVKNVQSMNSAINSLNVQLEHLVKRGKDALERVEGMTEGAKGKVLQQSEANNMTVESTIDI